LKVDQIDLFNVLTNYVHIKDLMGMQLDLC